MVESIVNEATCLSSEHVSNPLSRSGAAGILSRRSPALANGFSSSAGNFIAQEIQLYATRISWCAALSHNTTCRLQFGERSCGPEASMHPGCS